MLSPELKKLYVSNFYDYLRTKADRLLEIGYKEYRRRDAFKMPDFLMTKKRQSLLQSGCGQILLNKGLTPETAFENIGVEGFHKLMRVFHFKVVTVSTSTKQDAYFLDRMVIKHIVAEFTMILYNKVPNKIRKEKNK